jgi:hypothetical protein
MGVGYNLWWPALQCCVYPCKIEKDIVLRTGMQGTLMASSPMSVLHHGQGMTQEACRVSSVTGYFTGCLEVSLKPFASLHRILASNLLL